MAETTSSWSNTAVEIGTFIFPIKMGGGEGFAFFCEFPLIIIIGFDVVLHNFFCFVQFFRMVIMLWEEWLHSRKIWNYF